MSSFFQNNIEIKLQETILMKWMTDILKKFSKRKEPFTPSLAHSLSLMCEWVKKVGKQGVKCLNEVGWSEWSLGQNVWQRKSFQINIQIFHVYKQNYSFLKYVNYQKLKEMYGYSRKVTNSIPSYLNTSWLTLSQHLTHPLQSFNHSSRGWRRARGSNALCARRLCSSSHWLMDAAAMVTVMKAVELD